MNCLSGTPGLFTVMNSSAPCTKGVDLASTILPLSAFTAHADSLPVKLEDIETNANYDSVRHETTVEYSDKADHVWVSTRK